MTELSTATEEIAAGKRFGFGKNWRRFLDHLDANRIQEAEQSLLAQARRDSLRGLRFLDVGSGSGLFSLAARRLGATVHSLDFDPQSVACTQHLRSLYFPDDPAWTVQQGSVLDETLMRSLGRFDVVYSWGVLHHTGNLRQALENVEIPVAGDGTLILAIYNDQGATSQFWRRVKRIYCSGWFGKMLISGTFIPCFTAAAILLGLLRQGNPLGYFRAYKQRNRGMSVFIDWHDWLGGYPFEVARPEEIFEFYRDRGFHLIALKTTNRLGCNEFSFRRSRKGES